VIIVNRSGGQGFDVRPAKDGTSPNQEFFLDTTAMMGMRRVNPEMWVPDRILFGPEGGAVPRVGLGPNVEMLVYHEPAHLDGTEATRITLTLERRGVPPGQRVCRDCLSE
jgi:hypothetical protein